MESILASGTDEKNNQVKNVNEAIEDRVSSEATPLLAPLLAPKASHSHFPSPRRPNTDAEFADLCGEGTESEDGAVSNRSRFKNTLPQVLQTP